MTLCSWMRKLVAFIFESPAPDHLYRAWSMSNGSGGNAAQQYALNAAYSASADKDSRSVPTSRFVDYSLFGIAFGKDRRHFKSRLTQLPGSGIDDLIQSEMLVLVDLVVKLSIDGEPLDIRRH